MLHKITSKEGSTRIVDPLYTRKQGGFTSDSPFKTAPLDVTVFNAQGQVKDLYETPAGFQLERYVASTCDLSLRLLIRSEYFIVAVYQRDGALKEAHIGIYQNAKVKIDPIEQFGLLSKRLN